MKIEFRTNLQNPTCNHNFITIGKICKCTNCGYVVSTNN